MTIRTQLGLHMIKILCASLLTLQVLTTKKKRQLITQVFTRKLKNKQSHKEENLEKYQCFFFFCSFFSLCLLREAHVSQCYDTSGVRTFL